MLKSLFRFFSSVKLTVTCLVLACILVFWGTLAQVHLGLFKAQTEFFRSLFVYWPLDGSAPHIPIFPGGYLIGTVLLINLLAAHLRYYQPGRRKIGIVLIHLGVVLLLVGQMLTDFLSRESALHLRIGETKNYSEADRAYELAVIDTTETNSDLVVAIPCSVLARRGTVKDSDMPFAIRKKTFYANSDLTAKDAAGYEPVKISAGLGSDLWWRQLPRETRMDRVDMPSAIVELSTPQGSLGTFLVSAFLNQPQRFTFNHHTYEMLLRPERFYMPFSLTLLTFHHDVYPGTDIPKNFSSRLRLQNLDNGEDRQVLIYMNNPLRYRGETFYQASYDTDNQGSILQVVHNPGWLTPYVACVMVAVGLTWQFLSHLIPFLKRRVAGSANAGAALAEKAGRSRTGNRRNVRVAVKK
ncbi:MAG TPA: cytochrome c biogenesis protein ResB [Verrucomicrobiae bacterium]|nr:cytochrome c biogenesis protein ResB [Verrucomicrobiae bacterium]